MAVQGDHVKPRLLYFRWLLDDLPDFIAAILRSQVECLGQFFDVTLISESCDYDEMCDRHRPDLVMFESGVNAGPRRVTNTSAHPHIPKLGLIYADAYCVSRSAAISDMAQWGVRTWFTVSVSMGEYTPDIADDLFVWPNFIEPDIFRDYGESKTIPVLLTGSQATNYPWRNRVGRTVTQAFPTLTMPHGGWFRRSAAARMVHGERYARMINASLVAPTCGTIAQEVVRKHFEIPAARCCLITERTASIEAAGFVDMENCVFADDHDVLDKLDVLFADPQRLAQITDAGYELVHRRHTSAARDQVWQWYTLNRTLAPGQRIVQRSPFGPLEVVADPRTRAGGQAVAGSAGSPAVAGSAGNLHVINDTLDRALLRQGDENQRAGRYGAAEHLYLRCLNYHFMPEAALGLVISHLHQGLPGAALRRLTEMTELTLLSHRAVEPDPVEWAYLVRALLCAGRLGEAATRARQYPSLDHPELDRIRAVVGQLTGGAVPRQRSGVDPADRRRSVHGGREQSLDDWTRELTAMLRASGQTRLADRLPARPLPAAATDAAPLPAHTRMVDAVTVKRHQLRRKVVRRVRHELRRLSRRRPDPEALVRLIRTHAGREDVASVLVLGAVPSAHTDALTAGARTNPNRPTVFTVPDPADPAGPIRLAPGVTVADGQTLAMTRKTYGIETFDLAILGEAPGIADDIVAEIAGARTVLIGVLNRAAGARVAADLTAGGEHVLLEHDPSAGRGHAVFARAGTRGAPTSAAGDHA
jgi:hypothetical protein